MSEFIRRQNPAPELVPGFALAEWLDFSFKTSQIVRIISDGTCFNQLVTHRGDRRDHGIFFCRSRALMGALERTVMRALTIYYDGLCPLCQAEILFLKSRNHQRLLYFVDLQEPTFDASLHQVSCAQAMAKIHGRLDNGELLTGVPVFAEAYRRTDLTVLAWLISRKWVRLFLDPVYLIFARYRHAISRTLGPGLLRLARWRYP